MNFVLYAKLLILIIAIVVLYFLERKKLSKEGMIFLIFMFIVFGVAASRICNELPQFNDQITITALNEQGTSSNSTQIFISGFTIDGKDCKIKGADKGHWLWAGINNDLYAWLPEGHSGRTEDITDSITLLVPGGHARTINFLKDKYCGIATVSINDHTGKVDTSIEDKMEIGPVSLKSQFLNMVGYSLVLLILISLMALIARIIRLKRGWLEKCFGDRKVGLIYQAAQNDELNKSGVNSNEKNDDPTAIGNSMFSLQNSVAKQYTVTFIATMIIGTLIHMYMMTNKFPNPDDMMHMFDLGAGTIGGRWGLDLLSAKMPILNTSILPLFSMPWFNGITSLFFIAIAACLTVQVLKIRRISSCILISGIMVAFPTVAASLQYNFTAPSYFISLALAAYSVYLTKKYKYGCVAAVFILCFVLSIYQAFFFYSVGLFVVMLILECLEYNARLFRVTLDGIKYFVTLLMALALYFASVKISLVYFNTELTSYAGLNEMGHISLQQFPQMISNAYKQFLCIPNIVEEMADVRRLIIFCSVICSVINLVYIFVYRKIYKQILMPLLLLALCAIFPLACESIYLTNAAFYHELMIYPMVLPTVLTIALAERYRETLQFEIQVLNSLSLINQKNNSIRLKIFMFCLPLLLSLALIVNYAIITNEEYLAQNISYEQAYSYLNRLAMRMEETEGYSYDTPVAFIGNINNNSKPSVMSEYKSLTGLIGFNFDGEYPNENALLKNENSINCYMLKEYLGVVINKASNSQCDEAKSTVEFSEMKTYPQSGSIKMINGILVVKFEN